MLGELVEHIWEHLQLLSIFLFDSFSPPNGYSVPEGPLVKAAAGMDWFIEAKGTYCARNNAKII